MSSSTGTTDSGTTKDPEQLRREAEATREELAQTVDALVAKTQVKARAQDKAGRLTAQAREKAQQTRETTRLTAARVGGQVGEIARENPVPVAAAGAAVVVAAVVTVRHVRG